MNIDYKIHLKGHIDQAWSEWLNDSTIDHHPDGTTTITLALRDQAALFGLLIKIRDMGIPLISVNQIDLPDAPYSS